MSEEKKQQIDMREEKKQQIDIRDVYTEKTKSAKTHAVNWVKRYGYWSMIVVLFILAVLLSLITVGDVYQRTSKTQEEIFAEYVASGHVLTEYDTLIVKDLITEAYSKDETIPYNEYDKFIENIQSYTYERQDDTTARFDSLAFYLYKKTPQKFIDIQDVPEWKIVLIVMSGVLGVLVTITFMQTGIQDALITPSLKKAKDDLRQASINATKRRLRAERYFAKLYQRQLESVRRTELSLRGLIYEDYFNEEGRYKQGEYSKTVQDILDEVLKIKVAQLSFEMLATNVVNGKSANKNKLITIKDYTQKTALRSIIMKVLVIVFFTFVSVSLIVSARTPLEVFMQLISTILMFAAGVLEYLNSYSFIVEEYVETLNSKTRHLEAFIAYCEEEEELLESSKMRDDMKAQMIKELEDEQKEVTNV